MKILFFIQDLGMGGVLRQLNALARGLSQRGHGVSAAAMYVKDENWEHIWDGNPLPPKTLFPRKSYIAVPSPLFVLRATSRLRRIVSTERPDVLYCFSGNASMLVSRLALGPGSPTALVWGIRGSGNKIRLRNKEFGYAAALGILKWISPSVPLAIANSEAGLGFRRERGFRFRRELVVHNGIDTEKFRPDPAARARLRDEWGVGEDEKLVGMAGRMVPSKGFDVFLSAALRIAPEHPGARFVYLGHGNGDYEKRVAALAESPGLKGRIIRTGHTEDMRSFYNALDIYCSASYNEGFPNVVGEAMACGVPCVATNAGASAEIVSGLGTVVPAGDAEALARGLSDALSGPDPIDPSRLRARITERYSVDRMVENTEEALEALMSG